MSDEDLKGYITALRDPAHVMRIAHEAGYLACGPLADVYAGLLEELLERRMTARK